MAHTLTWSGGSVTVNGNIVTSPYTLQNGDVIVFSWSVDKQAFVNGLHCNNGVTLDLSDTDIELLTSSSGGGAN